jgi:uncharacterized Tic20 family protein
MGCKSMLSLVRIISLFVLPLILCLIFCLSPLQLVSVTFGIARARRG